jgi:hypothetical protein
MSIRMLHIRKYVTNFNIWYGSYRDNLILVPLVTIEHPFNTELIKLVSNFSKSPNGIKISYTVQYIGIGLLHYILQLFKIFFSIILNMQADLCNDSFVQ